MEDDSTNMTSSPAVSQCEESEQFSRQVSSDKRTALLLPPESPSSTTTDRPTYQRVPSLKEGSNVDGTDTGEPTSVLALPTAPSTQGGQEKMVVGLFDKTTVSPAPTDEPCSGADASQQQHAQATSEDIEPPEHVFIGKKRDAYAREEENTEKEKAFLEQELDIKEIETILHALACRNKREGFGSDCDENDEKDIIQVLRLATKLNRCGTSIKYCVRCGCRKKLVRRNGPNSHLWPKGNLKIIQQVHYREEKEFILNLTDGQRMGSGGLTAKLLCSKCENGDSKDEQWFRNLHLKLLSMKGCHELQVSNKENWLKRVFVKIMFLGLVININLPHGYDYDQVFLNLWRYYRFGNSPIDIRLFLLPSEAFVPISKLTFSLESALRNICFPSLIRRGEYDEYEFLYMQCDIFHVVLPISKESCRLFNRYYNCFLGSTEGAVVLRPTRNIWHGFDRAPVRTDHRDDSSRPPTGITFVAKDPKYTFPMILVKENAQRIPELLLKTVAKLQKKFEKKDEALVTRFPGQHTKYPNEIPPDDYPNLIHPEQCTSAPTESGEIFNPAPSKDANDEALLKAASEISILSSFSKELVGSLEQQLAREKQTNDELAEELATVKEERDYYKQLYLPDSMANLKIQD